MERYRPRAMMSATTRGLVAVRALAQPCAMPDVIDCAPPSNSLIAPFAAHPGHYADGYRTDVTSHVTLSRFIQAFYTTALFRAERAVLGLVGQSGTDADLLALAEDDRERFAAWSVEARHGTEILLADITGRTKSWLMVEPAMSGTRLWFGSVILADARQGKSHVPMPFAVLIGPHRVYSRALLSAAARRLTQQIPPPSARR